MYFILVFKLQDKNLSTFSYSLKVIADIDNDGIQEMVVAVSYFFDRE